MQITKTFYVGNAGYFTSFRFSEGEVQLGNLGSLKITVVDPQDQDADAISAAAYNAIKGQVELYVRERFGFRIIIDEPRSLAHYDGRVFTMMETTKQPPLCAAAVGLGSCGVGAGLGMVVGALSAIPGGQFFIATPLGATAGSILGVSAGTIAGCIIAKRDAIRAHFEPYNLRRTEPIELQPNLPAPPADQSDNNIYDWIY